MENQRRGFPGSKQWPQEKTSRVKRKSDSNMGDDIRQKGWAIKINKSQEKKRETWEDAKQTGSEVTAEGSWWKKVKMVKVFALLTLGQLDFVSSSTGSTFFSYLMFLLRLSTLPPLTAIFSLHLRKPFPAFASVLTHLWLVWNVILIVNIIIDRDSHSTLLEKR